MCMNLNLIFSCPTVSCQFGNLTSQKNQKREGGIFCFPHTGLGEEAMRWEGSVVAAPRAVAGQWRGGSFEGAAEKETLGEWIFQSGDL